MKTYVHNDSEGNIKCIVSIDAPDHVGLMLTPKAGLFVTKVEDIEFQSKLLDVKGMKEIAKNFKISVPYHISGLEKKTNKKSLT
ncbi:hypothetical protein [Mucilaginibacter sp.]|uniref:hypothetical protein n=1 Tax=Mucilaginibacter sp. TaxID=1882438 RepID=UPI00262BD8F5|nr:hypothetical protein [Mucilaginibacter sp.]MDB4923214.1 hypothetical protein [Mucilaginibacter sp.]